MTEKVINWSGAAKKQYATAILYIMNDSVQNAEKAELKFIYKLKAISNFPKMPPPDKYKNQ